MLKCETCAALLDTIDQCAMIALNECSDNLDHIHAALQQIYEIAHNALREHTPRETDDD